MAGQDLGSVSAKFAEESFAVSPYKLAGGPPFIRRGFDTPRKRNEIRRCIACTFRGLGARSGWDGHLERHLQRVRHGCGFR